MRIGFIGLGTMGGRMATSLRAAGHELFVNDIRPEAVRPHVEAGAVAALDARAVGNVTEVIFTSLPGPAEFTEVAVGIVLAFPLQRFVDGEGSDGTVPASIRGMAAAALTVWVGVITTGRFIAYLQ